ncbi:MAG TPA: SNF2-related protein [Blastocatellia bacterium]|nr:SNF2-related protein [Blastocatellia bacterium]HMX29133.1 SNF2-related protein [Blastocatellia bacterium]HNG34603.1 SNF2-related protein [Blastocatellia bacterium]
MYLTTHLRKYFDYNLQQRGHRQQWKVRLKTASPQAVEASLRALRIVLVRHDHQILAECTCEEFERNPVCEHLWAVLIEADRRNALQGDNGRAALELVKWDRAETGRHLSPAVATQLIAAPRPDKWKKQLGELDEQGAATTTALRQEAWPATRELVYAIDVPATAQGKGTYLEVFYRDRRKDGEWGDVRYSGFNRGVLNYLPEADDRFILSVLLGAPQQHDYSEYAHGYGYATSATMPRYRLLEAQPEILLPAICRTGRAYLRLKTPDHPNENDLVEWLPIRWNEDAQWQFRVAIEPAEEGDYEVRGYLVRDEERLELSEPVLVIEEGIFFTREQAMRYDHGGAFAWVKLLQKHKTIQVAEEMSAEFLGELLSKPMLPPLDLPEELQFETVQIAPRPRLKVKPPDKNDWLDREDLRGELAFGYGNAVIGAYDNQRGVYDGDAHTFCLRDEAAEQAAMNRLIELGWQMHPPDEDNELPRWRLAQSKLPRVVRELLAEGWQVEAEGKVYRQSGGIHMQITSGINWFDLHGTFEFDGIKAPLPTVLAALRKGETAVALGDGTFGFLPEEWLQKYGLLAGLGKADGDKLRFQSSQLSLLDALLSSQPEIKFDRAFAQKRAELKNFEGIAPTEQPEGFVGELRGYQKDGLGWMLFLQEYGFGGCLADDMGVGKTPQVLALLEMRRQLRAPKKSVAKGRKTKAAKTATPVNDAPPSIPPSLVVVPQSLVFNWQQEAARFTPELRVLNHTGQSRQKGETAHFADYDMILTTYGTLRNDVEDLKNFQFDYVVLDEAQWIKNATSASAKAARQLQGSHRLGMSGTPIENHLGELWSLFEFLNPGMLGAASVFKMTSGSARNSDEATRKVLAQALKPFILRRTKQQVATELPAKLEQTLYCELEPAERKTYNELRDYYRNTLLERIDSEGLGKSKIQVLEALLRLRQAALHPGLIDPSLADQDSAKLDLLLEQIDEVLEGDHKALVFSQFTSMLAILRDRLDKMGVVYEYLDGQTRNRQKVVERFQKDPEVSLFLISLKAGGTGLNLTAAEYVFLLDPWWNPAVEMQAIDRAHRIGQERQVFAHRLIARDTVEEKVLQLQADKRNLADAIISADNNLIRDLGREDLELLLS